MPSVKVSHLQIEPVEKRLALPMRMQEVKVLALGELLLEPPPCKNLNCVAQFTT